jgi:hypothetical protein
MWGSAPVTAQNWETASLTAASSGRSTSMAFSSGTGWNGNKSWYGLIEGERTDQGCLEPAACVRLGAAPAGQAREVGSEDPSPLGARVI